ncbi:MAG TPA: sirohydrochlorin chelatase [Pirellulales bacterium]|nr:sirohydrochlorin chelatase [Pirellulales bacterium]
MTTEAWGDRKALLVVGHGTNDEAGRREFAQVVAMAASRLPSVVVEPCFLELAKPAIAEGLARCVDRGARHVTVLPLLLFSAEHARHDIPKAIAAVPAGRDVHLEYAGTLDCHPAVLELSAIRFREALASTLDPDSGDKITLVFVGRGSTDHQACDEFCRFARLRCEQTKVSRLETCYLAMAEPNFERVLDAAENLPCRRIVVQSHLLFHGQLFDRVSEAVARRRKVGSEHRWVVTQPLGVHGLLVDAMIDIAGQTVG